MSILGEIENLSQEKKKIILYKTAEIYSDSDELLDFMENLEGENIDIIFNIIFIGNKKKREEIWNQEAKKYDELLLKISELHNKINKVAVEQKEFSEKSKDDDRIKEIENMFNN